MNTNVVTIRLSAECIAAYRYLQSLKINPAKYLRSGGEEMVICMAVKNKHKIKKYKTPF